PFVRGAWARGSVIHYATIRSGRDTAQGQGMGWGNAQRRMFAAVLATACGLAAALGIAPAMAGDGDAGSAGDSGGIRFGIDREEYDAQARAAMQGDPVVSRHLGAIRK